jgi:hypothetical protein
MERGRLNLVDEKSFGATVAERAELSKEEAGT